jgi:bifunctional non-homologous end joining protein LigD
VDCLPLSKLPDGPEWTYEIKLDGYRLEVVRKSRMTTLYSRRENVLNQRFPYIAAALQDLSKECVWVRPELVARIDFLEWTGADHLRHTTSCAAGG